MRPAWGAVVTPLAAARTPLDTEILDVQSVQIELPSGHRHSREYVREMQLESANRGVEIHKVYESASRNRRPGHCHGTDGVGGSSGINQSVQSDKMIPEARTSQQ